MMSVMIPWPHRTVSWMWHGQQGRKRAAGSDGLLTGLLMTRPMLLLLFTPALARQSSTIDCCTCSSSRLQRGPNALEVTSRQFTDACCQLSMVRLSEHLNLIQLCRTLSGRVWYAPCQPFLYHVVAPSISDMGKGEVDEVFPQQRN